MLLAWMTADHSTDADLQDWRLQAELQARAVPHGVLDRLRGSDGGAQDAGSSVPHDVVITHDGKQLFAYASDQATLTSARAAIERALQEDGIAATIRVSHWDDQLDDWHQIDPPLSAEEQRREDIAEADAKRIETRTLVASAGKLVRADLERSMLAAADKLGLECKIVEHPHLLTTQVAFTVTGPKNKIDDFSADLVAEGASTIRTDAAVMLSPL
jgi:hypothetical protein